MISGINAIKIEKYLKQDFIKNTALVPQKAKQVRIANLSRIGASVNAVYSFSLIYRLNNKDSELKLTLKLYEPTDAQRKICQKEHQIMRYLKEVSFPVPDVYAIEKDESFLGGPFIIMEMVEGVSLANCINRLKEKEASDTIERFAATLAFLHELEISKTELDVLPILGDACSYAKKSALTKDQFGYAKFWDYEWVTNWLKVNAEKCPCDHYSLVHFDMNLKNFIVANNGRILFLDWEWAEIGDGLLDVACAYHEIAHSVSRKAASLFITSYIKSSKRKIDYLSLRFYLVVTGLNLALYFRYLASKELGTRYLVKLFGARYTLFFPIIRWHFRRRGSRLENFLRSEVLDYEKAMFDTPGGRILSSMEKEDILKLTNADSSDVVLDVGTASGRIAREVTSKTRAKVIGIDVGRPLKTCAKNRKRLNNYELVVADGQYMPFRNCSFNAIICIRALKYFPNYELGLSEFTRVLKPSGRLVFDLSSVLGHEVILRYITHSLRARRHRVFNFYKMKPLLARKNLSIVESIPWQKIPHPIWNLTRNSTVLQLLVVAENKLKSITPLILSRSVLLKCVKIDKEESADE